MLDGLGLGRVPFVGISYGAGIALRTAGYAPERVSGAVLVSPAAVASGPLARMLLEVLVPRLGYRLRPSRERLLRAARAILTEHDDLSPNSSGPFTGTSSSTHSCRGWPLRRSLEALANRWWSSLRSKTPSSLVMP